MDIYSHKQRNALEEINSKIAELQAALSLNEDSFDTQDLDKDESIMQRSRKSLQAKNKPLHSHDSDSGVGGSEELRDEANPVVDVRTTIKSQFTQK